jgi:hypothetical protein
MIGIGIPASPLNRAAARKPSTFRELSSAAQRRQASPTSSTSASP